MDVQDPAAPPPLKDRRNPAIDQARRIRRTWVTVGSAMAAASMASLVGLAALLQPPRPITVVTLGADYADNLSVPHNAYGWNSLQAVSDLGGGQAMKWWAAGPLYRGPAEPIRVEHASHLVEAIDSLTGTTAVLVVSLHGGGDDQGAYLLGSDCSPDDPLASRIRVTDLLERLARLPSSQSKVLVFDATSAPGNTAYGEAENGFAAALHSLNDQIVAIPNLVVLSASDIGQRSWREPVVGRTVFLHTLVESLRGAACDRNQDGRFSAKELVQHLSVTVPARVSVTRERTQTPVLLPHGEEGMRRAERIELSVADSVYDFAVPTLTTVPTEEITARWEYVRHLEAELPSPERTATVQWRRYRRMMIRYEQLLCAGATESAQRVSERLAYLESGLRRDSFAGGRLLDPIQLADQVASTEVVAVADKAMAQLAIAPIDAVGVTADKVLGSVDPEQRIALRRLLYDKTLQGAISDPVGALRRSAAIAQALSTPGQPKPAEAQLLVLLAEGLPDELADPAWSSVLRLAIRVRCDAEQALMTGQDVDRSLTPAVVPWLRESMDVADGLRREGEDLLFGGADYLPRATRALRSASELYAAIQADTLVLRAAIDTRNTAFDLLPFYNEVASARCAVHGDDPKEIDSLVGELQAAWLAAHQLGDRLISFEASDSSVRPKLSTISALTSDARSHVDAVKAALGEWRARLVTRTGAAFCNNRIAALSAPDLGAGERLQFLGVGPPDADEAATDQRELRLCQITQLDWRTEETLRRTRLAVAAFGERLQAKSNQGQSFDEVLQRLNSLQADDRADEDAIADATQLTAELRGARLAVRLSIASAARASLSGDLAEAESARLVFAGAAVRRIAWGVAPASDSTILKQLVMRQQAGYYNWCGGRALADAWNETAGDEAPYYQLAATAYARLAERAVSGLDATERVLEQAAVPYQLTLNLAPRADVVADGATELPLGFVGSNKLGHAVVSVEAAGGVVLETPAAGIRLVGSLVENDPDSTPAVVIRAAKSPSATTAADDWSDTHGEVHYRGWFRGHRATVVTPVFVHRTPDIATNDPPRPPAAGVAIIAPSDAGSNRDGGITLVVDASGSMGPVATSQASKYTEAVETVRTLLSETSAGVQVSVWVFGQAIGPQKTAEVPEAAIECVLEPIRWDPEDPTIIDRVTKRLAYPRIEPWNESALARTLLTASRDLHGVSGYKTLIAITDGIDNCFAKDAVANPRQRPLGEVLAQELKGTGIVLQVVGFKVSGEERAAARQQFGFLGQMTPPGRWWEASEREGLTDALRQILGEGKTSPLLNRGRDGIVRHVSDAFVTPMASTPSWPSVPSPPGLYSLPSGGELSPQQTLLSGGDLLLLSRVRAPSGPTFLPISYSATHRPDKPAVETAGWRAAVLNHRRLPDGSSSALLAIERRPGADELPYSMLQVERPSDLWIECTTPDGGSCPIRWSPVYGYPSPCWDVVRGRADSTPEAGRLRVWWAPPEGPTVTRAIRRGEAFQRPADLIGKSWDVEGQPVSLRRLAVEQRDLPDPTGRSVSQSCLVVELEGGPRCRIRLQGCVPEGSRHHYYDDAKRSIAVFWPIGPEQLRDQLDGIDLTSLPDFKRESERLGLTASFADLPDASPGDLRPTPSVGWFDAPAN